MSDETQETFLAAGAILKRAREKAGLSLVDVSTSTKINAKVLQALEEGDLDKLPAKSFTRGFIRVYSQYLKVDPQPIIEAYNMDDPFLSTLGREIAESSKEAKKESTATPPSERISGLRTDRNLARPILVAGIIVLIFIVVGIKKIVDRYSQETILPTTVATESGTKIVSPTDEVDTVDSDEREESAELATEELASETVSTQSADSPPPEPNLVQATVTVAPTPTAAPTVAPTKAPEATAKSQQVVIEALDQVEVSVRVDGQRAAKMKLAPGSVHTINANQKIELDVADGGLINVIVNGKDVGSAGDLGSPAKLKFPR